MYADKCVNHHRGMLQRTHFVQSEGNQGCSEWENSFPDAKGSNQSPINLVSRDAQFDAGLDAKQLTFNYSTSRETDILNNGHTLAIFPRSNQAIAGGPLPRGMEFELSEIRFHWGRENTRGSEHTVNDKAFPMEVQLIHWNTNLYGSVEEAIGKHNGVAIVTLFTQIGREHQNLRAITETLEEVQYKGRQKTITSPFNPNCLLPDPTLRDYWTYSGSLTTPPCSENVTWILFRYPLMISHSQMEDFRRLRTVIKGDQPRGGHDGMMVDNFRPTQPLHGRSVRASFQS